MDKVVIHNPMIKQNLYTLNFPDDTFVACTFIEHVPFEPSAYHWDEGIIVSPVGTDNLYFISTMNGIVYGGQDSDPGEITKVIEGAYSPEINEFIEADRRREQQLEDSCRDDYIKRFKAGNSIFARAELVELFKENKWDINLIPEAPDA